MVLLLAPAAGEGCFYLVLPLLPRWAGIRFYRSSGGLGGGRLLAASVSLRSLALGCCCSSSGRRRRCTEEDGGVTFHPPRLPRELARRYVLIQRRERKKGTRTELSGPGCGGGFPERRRSESGPGAAAAAAWRAAPPALHSHPRRRSQSGRGVLRAAACACAPPPPRRAALPPRRPSPPPRRAPGSARLGSARLHPGGAPRHRRAPAPRSPPPGRRRGAHLLRGARMPGALPAPSPARPAAGARRGTAGRGRPALPAVFGRSNARSRPRPPPRPAPRLRRRGSAARKRMHRGGGGGGLFLAGLSEFTSRCQDAVNPRIAPRCRRDDCTASCHRGWRWDSRALRLLRQMGGIPP
ncbi:uncharacterized protein LOC142409876 [Mycteria americana]|uniref:uncharacterized protein LOC142409876 n=1 Tax=Mycteria americana TaxID=33587 RepID=UPI003F58A3B1